MKNIHLTVLMLLTLLFSACKDDKFGIAGDYSEGDPTVLTMKITVPAKNTIISRSLDADFESRINQMVIIGFEVNTGRKIFHNITSQLESGNYTEAAGRTYSLSSEINTYTGIYNLYLIANWQSVYANLTADEIEAMTESEIQQIDFKNVNKSVDLFGDYGMPMSQKIENYQLNLGSNTLTGVSMRRATANITFLIKNATHADNAKIPEGNEPNFTPTGYTVYRLPESAKGFEEAKVVTTGTFDSPNRVMSEPEDLTSGWQYEFDFYMLENNQEGTLTDSQKAAITSAANPQAAREAWEGNTNDYASRKFTNAPESSTFVVIRGNYTGPAGMDGTGNYSSVNYSGEVNYIIHLGNMDASQGGSADNFNVLRNEMHTYRVTINGANSILVNVDVNQLDKHNPGMEGFLNEQPVADLDAHYNKVMLQILGASIYASNDTEHNNTLVLQTPVNGFNRVEININNLTDTDDYKWVQFQKPGTDLDVFPRYAGVDNYGATGYGYITDLVKEIANYKAGTIQASDLKYCSINGNYFATAAFVDENVYSDNSSLAIIDWAGEARTRRVMTLNPNQRKVSQNEQNTVNNGSSFSISQLPVVSTYSLTRTDLPNYNPTGFEQIMEETNIRENAFFTAATSEYGPYAHFYKSALDYGQMNTSHTSGVFDDAKPQQMTLDLKRDITINEDYTSFYKLGGSNESATYSFTPSEYTTVAQAIAIHNRDLNGNGEIDDDEIRWYIPTATQLYIYNFGYDQISNTDLWLSDPEQNNLDLQSLPGKSADKAFPRYITSSRRGQRLFWQDMRGVASNIENWSAPFNNIRFARNLGKFSGSYNADITRMSVHDSDRRIISFINPLICRNFSWTEPYPAANVRSEYNLLPKAFQYMEDPINVFTNNSTFYGLSELSQEEQVAKIYEYTIDAVNEKYSTSYTKLPNGWRVPNQRELIVLYINNVIRDMVLANKFTAQTASQAVRYDEETGRYEYIGYVFSTTFMSGTLYATARNNPICFSPSGMDLSVGYSQPCMRVILVRDVDPATGEPIAEQTDTILK